MVRFRLFLALILIFVILGCRKAEQKHAVQPEANQAQSALANAEARMQKLSAQVEQLQIENQRLRGKNTFLESQNRNLLPRIQRLMDGYGTGIWDYDATAQYPVFVESLKGAGVRGMIVAMNKRFRRSREPIVLFKKKEGNTVFIGVDNDEQLGEQMGSDGALGYMTSVAYSLTSIPGVQCVYFAIEGGEHASPGKYCKGRLEPLEPQ